MKRLLLLATAVLCAGQLLARSKPAVDFFVEFNTMEERHKKDWFEHMNRLHEKKMKLLQTQMHDWVGLKNKHLKSAKQQMSDCSMDARDAKIAGHLDDAISTHKKHKEQWKSWSDAIHSDAHKLAERHDKELEQFEKRYRKEYKQEPAVVEIDLE